VKPVTNLFPGQATSRSKISTYGLIHDLQPLAAEREKGVKRHELFSEGRKLPGKSFDLFSSQFA
jgi:hypothetical protein